MLALKKYFGPSTLIAAAFIGPGTLTTCTLAGVQTGYEMLWVMLFAVAAVIILQETAARLGFATGQGLGEAFNRRFTGGISRVTVYFLVISAVLIGNAAYEAGNISGGVLGFELLWGERNIYPWLIGIFCFLLMFFGKYKRLEQLLIGLVILMSICFLVTAILVRPDPAAVLQGFIPRLPARENFLLLAAVIGTTVVPYNLFLHASVIAKHRKTGTSLRDLRIENAVSVILGGLISGLIIITAAASGEATGTVKNAADLAVQLEPLFGQSAKIFTGIGLAAAGISSALTAPLAAAYAARGLFGRKGNETDAGFRAVWILILLIGVIVTVTDPERVLVIKFAQITNAVLLPFIAAYLLYLSNDRNLMGAHANGTVANVLGASVVLLTFLLSIKSLGSVFGWF